MPLYLFSDVYYCNYMVLKIILCLYRRLESVLLCGVDLWLSAVKEKADNREIISFF